MIKTYQQFLIETLVTFPKRTGQAVFLAGGSRSGKSTFKNQFLGLDNFANYDVDDLKVNFLKLAQSTDKYDELKSLDFHNPGDVYKAHEWIKSKGLHNKVLDNLILKSSEPRNIVFDLTMKDLSNWNNIVPKLLQAGYNQKDIHVIWVLADLSIALNRNELQKTLPGGRVVPRSMVISSHEGVAEVMLKTIFSGKPFPGMDGKIVIVPMSLATQVAIVDNNGKTLENHTIQDIKYYTIKDVGQQIKSRQWFNEAVWQNIEPILPKSAIALKDS